MSTINTLHPQVLRVVTVSTTIVAANKVLKLNEKFSASMLAIYILGNLVQDYLKKQDELKRKESTSSSPSKKIEESPLYQFKNFLAQPEARNFIQVTTLGIIFGVIIYGKDYNSFDTYYNALYQGSGLLGFYELFRTLTKEGSKLLANVNASLQSSEAKYTPFTIVVLKQILNAQQKLAKHLGWEKDLNFEELVTPEEQLLQIQRNQEKMTEWWVSSSQEANEKRKSSHKSSPEDERK